jgi:hypothetical protein
MSSTASSSRRMLNASCSAPASSMGITCRGGGVREVRQPRPRQAPAARGSRGVVADRGGPHAAAAAAAAANLEHAVVQVQADHAAVGVDAPDLPVVAGLADLVCHVASGAGGELACGAGGGGRGARGAAAEGQWRKGGGQAPAAVGPVPGPVARAFREGLVTATAIASGPCGPRDGAALRVLPGSIAPPGVRQRPGRHQRWAGGCALPAGRRPCPHLLRCCTPARRTCSAP